jgi:hypothetical protein
MPLVVQVNWKPDLERVLHSFDHPSAKVKVWLLYTENTNYYYIAAYKQKRKGEA